MALAVDLATAASDIETALAVIKAAADELSVAPGTPTPAETVVTAVVAALVDEGWTVTPPTAAADAETPTEDAAEHNEETVTPAA